MENAYTRTPAEALKHFQVTEEKGLSEQQVKSLREKHGKNGMLAAKHDLGRCVLLTKEHSSA
jgi:magnesium-transporting ATPase (P-type)